MGEIGAEDGAEVSVDCHIPPKTAPKTASGHWNDIFCFVFDFADIDGEAARRDFFLRHDKSIFVFVLSVFEHVAEAVNDEVADHGFAIGFLNSLSSVKVAQTEGGENLLLLVQFNVLVLGRFECRRDKRQQECHHNDHDGGIDNRIGILIRIHEC